MNAQHSPAPWSLRGDIIRDANGVLLYRLTPLDEITIAQDLANRRLIEAGPEMLSLLQRLTHPMASDSAVDDARALLAKPEGTQ